MVGVGPFYHPPPKRCHLGYPHHNANIQHVCHNGHCITKIDTSLSLIWKHVEVYLLSDNRDILKYKANLLQNINMPLMSCLYMYYCL